MQKSDAEIQWRALRTDTSSVPSASCIACLISVIVRMISIVETVTVLLYTCLVAGLLSLLTSRKCRLPLLWTKYLNSRARYIVQVFADMTEVF
jgi:hypothetical protein